MLGIRHLRHLQAGDTIVEVLIAIAVVGAVLGSSFAVINHMLNNAQQAKEHEEALELLEGQVEMLKVAAKNTTPPTIFTFSPSGSFCLNSGVDVVSTSDPACSQGTSNRYHLSVSRNGSTNTFYAYAKWAGPTGGQEQVNLIYRVYPSS